VADDYKEPWPEALSKLKNVAVKSSGPRCESTERKLMKFMLLVHHDHEAFARRSEIERKSLLQESVQLANELHASGQYLGAAPLHPSSETTCVRVRDGKRLVTDGPFAETREQIGGYFLVEARDRNEAIDIAARIPGARIGTVEVREVTEVDGLPES
jgi:hypothetical protein